MNISNNWSTSFRYFVLTIVIIFGSLAVWYLQEMIQPMIAAGVLAYLLSPLVQFVAQHTKLSRKVAGNIVFFVGLGIIIVVLATVLPASTGQLSEVLKDLTAQISGLQQALAKPIALGPVKFNFSGLIPSFQESISGGNRVVAEDALRVIESTSRGFLWFLVIVVTSYYLLTDWDALRDWLIGLAPDPYQDDARQLYKDIKEVWLGYLGGQVRLILILAVVYTVVWVSIGLPGALFLGVLAGILNLLPEVGPFFAAALAILVAFLEGSDFFVTLPNIWFAVLTLGVYLLINNVKTVWLQPRILGRSVFLHEGLVFVAIVVAIILQGFLVVLIVVPLIASFGIISRYIRRRLVGLPPFEIESDLPATTDKINQVEE